MPALSKELWAARTAAGECPYCGERATMGTMCKEHRLRSRGYAKKSQAARYLRRKIAGVCPKCQAPPCDDSVLCRECRDLENGRHAARRKRPGHKERKTKKQRALRRKLYKQGRCQDCPKPREYNRVLCLGCAMKRTDRRDPRPRHFDVDEYATARNNWEAA